MRWNKWLLTISCCCCCCYCFYHDSFTSQFTFVAYTKHLNPVQHAKITNELQIEWARVPGRARLYTHYFWSSNMISPKVHLLVECYKIFEFMCHSECVMFMYTYIVTVRYWSRFRSDRRWDDINMRWERREIDEERVAVRVRENSDVIIEIRVWLLK